MVYGLFVEGEGDFRCLVFLNIVEEVVVRQLWGCKGGFFMKKKSFEGRCFGYWVQNYNFCMLFVQYKVYMYEVEWSLFKIYI